MIYDGDLDRKKNYYQARQGGNDAGDRFKAKFLDPHVSWYVDGELYHFGNVYNRDFKKWKNDKFGVMSPTIIKGKEQFILHPKKPVYSNHTPGVAFFAFPFSWFIQDTVFFE